MLRGETDACKVVNSTLQLVIVSVQKIDGGLDAVIDVDHGKECLGLEEALVVPIFKGLKEDF